MSSNPPFDSSSILTEGPPIGTFVTCITIVDKSSKILRNKSKKPRNEVNAAYRIAPISRAITDENAQPHNSDKFLSPPPVFWWKFVSPPIIVRYDVLTLSPTSKPKTPVVSEPFVFHFTPGTGGRVEAMYMIDLDCRCALCGHEQFQRFYHSTPFHELTVPALVRLADEAPLKAGYRCKNCGDSVGADEVRHSCLTFGFADDAGVIRLFRDLQSGTTSCELTGRRRLDPQVMPRWTADADAHDAPHRVIEDLDEAAITTHLHRPINVKLPWRDLLAKYIDADRRRHWSRIAPGLVVAAYRGDAPSRIRAATHFGGDGPDIDSDIDPDTLAVIDLVDSRSVELPTHQHSDSFHGRWTTWCDDDIREAIDAGRLHARAFIRPQRAIDIVERTLRTARLDATRHATGTDTVFEDISAPGDTTAFNGSLSIRDVLHRAVYTGLTPGESARLTTEEIVGALLKLW